MAPHYGPLLAGMAYHILLFWAAKKVLKPRDRVMQTNSDSQLYKKTN